jgi:hypothetical protein
VVAGERDRPDVARVQWTKYQGRVEPERLVLIDETWTRTDMAPLRGWAARGLLNSSISSGRPPLEPSMPPAPQSAKPSKPSRPKNAPTISKTQAIEPNIIML